MSYTDEAGVQKLIKRLYPNGMGNSATPSGVDVEALIEETSAEIDMALSSVGYTIPVSSPVAATTWLKLICEYGTAALVCRSAFPESQTVPNGSPNVPVYAFYEKRYQDAITKILNRDIVLVGVEMGSASLASTYLTDNPDNDPWNDGSTSGQQPIFMVGKRLQPEGFDTLRDEDF